MPEVEERNASARAGRGSGQVTRGHGRASVRAGRERIRDAGGDVKTASKPTAPASGSGRKGRKGRERRSWAMSADERRAERRGKVLRAVACVAVVAVCAALTVIVGTDEYRPTIMGWMPLVAVLTAILLAFIYARVLKRRMVLLEKSSVTDCQRAERVMFKVRFRNASPLFCFRMEAHFYTADLYGNPVSHAVTTMSLAPFEVYDMPFATSFDHIGTYQAGLDRVVIYDFLRLFSATLEGPKRTRVNVTPKLVSVPNLDFSNDAVVETTKAARSAISDSMDYAAVREYVWGDPLKNIHWKISARTPTYMTKLYETYNNPGVAIVLDFYGPGQDALTLMRMFDAVVETGFSVARYAAARGMDTEIHYCDKSGARVRRTTWRRADLPQIVADMPQFTSEPKAAADALGVLNEQIRSIHGQSNIVVCTANLSAQMIETIVSAKVHRREPLVFAVVPQGLEGRERDQWLAPLARLDAAGIGYLVLSDSTDMLKVK